MQDKKFGFHASSRAFKYSLTWVALLIGYYPEMLILIQFVPSFKIEFFIL